MQIRTPGSRLGANAQSQQVESTQNPQRGFLIGSMRLPKLQFKSNAPLRRKYTEKGDVTEFLRECLNHNPSDIHINVGHPVVLEINGRMFRLNDHELDWPEFESFARVIRDKEGATTILSQSQDYDGAYVIKDSTHARRRLRVNMTALNSIRNPQSGSIVMRPLQDTPPRPAEIGISEELLSYCFPRKGGVFVVGPTGSGKTSTFGSVIRHAAETGSYHGHFRAYESPPEFDLEALSSEHLLITQVAIDVPWGLSGFDNGVRNAMRAHPVCLMIGEVRDYQTVKAIVEASQTGHPVYGTVHADSPAAAFQRLLTRYPAEEANAAMFDLIESTQLIIAQNLVNRIDGSRVAIREWIAFDDKLRDQLLQLPNPGLISSKLRAVVEERGNSFANSIRELLKKGEISQETAQKYGI